MSSKSEVAEIRDAVHRCIDMQISLRPAAELIYLWRE